MKKAICLILSLLLFTGFAMAENAESIRLEFEEGFALTLPADWVSYEVDDASKAEGMLYCLGNPEGSRLMYIQHQAVSYPDMDALENELKTLKETADPVRYDYENASFLVYRKDDSDCSGCMTLFNDGVLSLLFTPKSDTEFMLTAATIMESFDILQ